MKLFVVYESKTLEGYGPRVGISNIIGEFRSLEEVKPFVEDLKTKNPNSFYSVSDVYGKQVIFDSSFGWKEETKEGTET